MSGSVVAARSDDGKQTAAIYALVDPRMPDQVRYVGNTVQSLSARLTKHLANPSSAVARWMDEIAPVVPEIIELTVVDVDPDFVTEGGVAEGPVHDVEYAVMEALDALGHNLLNHVGHRIARHHRGTSGHQGGTHSSPLAGQRALRTGPHGNKNGLCGRPDCRTEQRSDQLIEVRHFKSKHTHWYYCSATCRSADEALIAEGEL